MATRKTTTTTRKAPTTTRAPKAPSTPQKAPTGRQRAARDGQAKGNKFDAIARAVATGDDDLARQLQDSITAAKDGKAKAGSTRKGMPSVPDDATGRKVVKVTSTYKGRPTSNVATIAQRAKESGLRVRASMDVADIAQRLRATPDAIAVWLAARDGSKPTAPAKPAKPAKPTAPAKLAVTLRHPWVDREPDYLRGHVLRFTYTVDPNTGHVTSQLHAIEGPDGNVLPDRGRDLPLDFRPAVETLGNGRKVVLRDCTIAGLTAWLQTQGLTEQQ